MYKLIDLCCLFSVCLILSIFFIASVNKIMNNLYDTF